MQDCFPFAVFKWHKLDWSALIKHKALSDEGGKEVKEESVIPCSSQLQFQVSFPLEEVSPIPPCCPSVASVVFVIYFLFSLGAAARGVSLLCRLFLMLRFPC